MDQRLLDFGLRAAAATRSKRLDAGLGEATRALNRVGIRCVLLKGPAVGGWLYGSDETREYLDIDLLVAESDLDDAEQVLEGLGFEDLGEPEPLLLVNRRHRVWGRAGDGVVVELHWTLLGTGAPPAVMWGILGEATERVMVGGAQVEVLSVPARAMHLALHAVQHGAVGRPREDLQRGIVLLDLEVWEQARDLAVRLEWVSPFAAGLRASPVGRELADRLGLPEAFIYWRLRSRAPETAGRLWYLRHAPAWCDRWRLVVWFLPQTRGDTGSDRWWAIAGDLARAVAVVPTRVRAARARHRTSLAMPPGRRAGPARWPRLPRVRPRG